MNTPQQPNSQHTPLNSQQQTRAKSTVNRSRVVAVLALLTCVLSGLLWSMRFPLYIVIVPFLILMIIGFFAIGYRTDFSNLTGFVEENAQGNKRPKTLWNWLELLIIPLVIAGGTVWFNAQQSDAGLRLSQQQHVFDTQQSQKQHQADQDISADQQQETVLKTYISDMKDLLLTNRLLASNPGDAVRDIARAETLTTLRELNPKRKVILLQFLYESLLINEPRTIIQLKGADLNHVDLSIISGSRNKGLQVTIEAKSPCNVPVSYTGANNLSEANLSGTNLEGADLSVLELRGINLSAANLHGAKLDFTDLQKANLRGANLSNATLKSTVLVGAYLNIASHDRRVIDPSLNITNLSFADMTGANLSCADLSYTEMQYANLTNAQLEQTNLSYATMEHVKVTKEQLARASSLQGTETPTNPFPG